MLPVVSALLACTGSEPADRPRPHPVVTEQEVAGFSEDPGAWLFDDTVIHEVAITLPPASVAALDATPFDYAVGDVVVDGYAVPSVGVRLRGKIGSFRYLSGKPKMRVDFSAFVPGREFYGLGSLTLNNSVVDCSYLKDAAGYRVFRDLGVPAPRTSWVHVTVNDADYGLYVLIETEDDRFLERSFADGTGNLYDGKYVLYDDWTYTLLDFDRDRAELYELEEGTDVGHADIYGIVGALEAFGGGAGWLAATDPVIDWEATHRQLVGEQWVGHIDGYALNTNNNRVYFDPEDGKAELLPYDLDYAFLDDWEWGLDWRYPRGRLAGGCFADPECAEQHRQIVGESLDRIDTDAILAWYDASWERISESAHADPRRECQPWDLPAQKEDVRAWVAGGNDAMRTFWALP